jgi:two-component system chemotaxis sensor kinase CheA
LATPSRGWLREVLNDHDDLVARLLASFVEELEGHVAALNRDFLELERATTERRDDLLHALLRTTHTIKGASRAAAVPVVEHATHALEEILIALRDHSIADSPLLYEMLFGVTDAMADIGERLARGQSLAGAPLEGFLPRLADLAPAISTAPVSSRTLAADSARSRGAAPAASDAIRVRSGHVDDLVEQVSELLVTWRRQGERAEQVDRIRAMAAAMATRSDAERRRLVGALDRFASVQQSDAHKLAGDLKQLDASIKRLRMVPFNEACLTLERAVRDLANAASKSVSLVLRGADVELDRAVLDGLRDPLLHLVRNAVDHGIEPPDERASKAKATTGVVTVTATLRGAEVLVTVSDDGRGLDLEGIRSQLRRRGLAVPSSDRELAQSIFTQGLSTARTITDVSGRGVGLDVVKRAVETLRGTIEVSFEPGHGTTFALAVPLTLSALRAVLVRVAGSVFALPGSSVRKLLRVASGDIATVGSVQTVLVDGVAVAVSPLAELLGMTSTPLPSGGKAALVVIGAHGVEIAVVVDELLEEREVVVQSVGPRLAAVGTASGVTVLPSGRLALILSPSVLVARARATARAPTLFADAVADPRARRVLLVDDSLTTRTLERSILESAGYVVLVAADGVEAWALLQERGADVVVSDVEMPRMDGFTLTETIRSSTRFRETPVVLVTGLARAEDRARGMEVGANAYLVKSAFDQANLLETIRQFL